MPRVLIVEDSPDQGRLVEAFLESQGYYPHLCSSGEEALIQLQRDPPDIVVSDVVMEGMDGFELVERIVARYPGLPVVLMTAFDGGELAAKALRFGAASYVPKHRMREDLSATIERTLAIAQEQLQRERMLQCIVGSKTEFELSNDQALIPLLVDAVQKQISHRYPQFDDNELMRVGMALQEALLNAMHHGNLEVSSDLREDDREVYDRMVEKRANDPRYKGRKVRLIVLLSATELVFEVEDDGVGFDLGLVPDPTDAENLLKTSGRGLFLIWTFMDEVHHEGDGNRIVMTKRIAKTVAAPQPCC